MAELSNDEKMERLYNPSSAPKEEVQEAAQETQKEVPVEAKETPTEQPKETPTEVPKETPVESKDIDISLLNQAFGKEYDSLDAYKTLFEKADGYDTTKSEYETLQKQLEEYKHLAEGLDPLSYFDSEEDYITQQFKIQNKGKFSEEALKELSALSPSKVEGMDGVDALKVNLMVNEGMTSEEAEAYLLRQYDTDDLRGEDLELGTKAAIKKDVNSARRALSDLYKDIKVPEKVDFQASREQLKSAWEKPLSEVVSSFNEIELPDGGKFVVTDDMKKGFLEESMDVVMGRQVGFSEEAIADIKEGMKQQVIYNNLDKILKSRATDIEERLKDKYRSDIHNDKPFEEGAKPSQTTDDNESKMRKFLY